MSYILQCFAECKTHTGSSGGAGGHSHTLGSQNITGSMSLTAAEGTGFVSGSYSGALYPINYYGSQIFDPWGGQDCWHGIGFNAANNWSGATSTVANHTHTITNTNTGGGQAHNNIQPYLVVKMWKRTA